MKYSIGIDIGTSGTKAIVFDTNGKMLAESSAPHSIRYPAVNMCEQSPYEWKEAVLSCLKDLSGKTAGRIKNVVSIGLSGQMHGLVLLDSNCNILRPAIIWCDTRSEEEAKEIEAHFGRELFSSITGNPPMPGFTLSKLLWVKRHEPAIYSRIAHVLLPKDYVRFCLNGTFVTDYSDVSGMQVFDIGKDRYSKEILAFLELNENVFPAVVSSWHPTGTISETIASYTGLPKTTQVAGSAGDQPASSLGSGVTEQGSFNIMMGSSGVVYAPLSKERMDPKGRIQSFLNLDKNRYSLMGCTLACGTSMRWLRDTIYSSSQEEKPVPYSTITREACCSPLGANGVAFLPYLLGERSPILDPDARGVFFGISASTKRGDLARATMEGISYSIKDCYLEIKKHKLSTQSIRISGGCTKSQFWLSMIADILECPLEVIQGSESGCLGAAILGFVSAKQFATVQEASRKMVRLSSVIEPNRSHFALYRQGYSKYKEVYESLKETFKHQKAE